MSEAVSIWMWDEIIKEVESRGENRSYVVNRDLERLYDLYRRELMTVPLSLNEALLILDVLNGAPFSAGSTGMAKMARLLWASVEDGCRLNKLHEKWDVGAEELIGKLYDLSPIQALAICDAAERFWQEQTGSADDEMVKRFFPQVED